MRIGRGAEVSPCYDGKEVMGKRSLFVGRECMISRSNIKEEVRR